MHMALPSNFFSTQSVLLVDDIDTIRSAVKGMLQMLGCQDIALANTGERALELCEVKQYDFILCDFNLGKGKDGYQLFEELKLRALLKINAVFILISAETAVQIVHGIVELQPDDYLLKPFSYKKLESRLIRALEKRKVLGSIYDALAIKDYKKALIECVKYLKKNTQYTLSIMRLQGEVLLKLQQYDSALSLYDSILNKRDLSWAKLGKAIVYYHKKDYSSASVLLNELVELRETRIEALNWLASIYAQRDCLEQAKDILIESVKLSPKNIPRQRALANLSVLDSDWALALHCFKIVLNNTRFSVHENIDHHFNYIHCLIDKAKTETELQQAKVFSQVQAVLKNASLRFDKIVFTELEKIVFARLSGLKNLLSDAIKNLNLCDQEIVLQTGKDSTIHLANTWFELGHYERYLQLIALLPKQEVNDSIESMSDILRTNKISGENRAKIKKLQELNQQGLILYKSGLYPASSTLFLEAFNLIPNNLPMSLNLAQSINKGWPSNEAFSMKKRVIKHCINIIESQKLDEKSQARYESFEAELKKEI